MVLFAASISKAWLAKGTSTHAQSQVTHCEQCGHVGLDVVTDVDVEVESEVLLVVDVDDVVEVDVVVVVDVDEVVVEETGQHSSHCASNCLSIQARSWNFQAAKAGVVWPLVNACTTKSHAWPWAAS